MNKIGNVGSAAMKTLDNAYDATKANIKKGASNIKKGATAVVNAPSNLKARVDKFKKDHNFSHAHSGVKQANAAL